MVTYATSTISGTRLPCGPATAQLHMAKPWQGVVVAGGFRLGVNRIDDNSTGVSAHERRHE